MVLECPNSFHFILPPVSFVSARIRKNHFSDFKFIFIESPFKNRPVFQMQFTFSLFSIIFPVSLIFKLFIFSIELVIDIDPIPMSNELTFWILGHFSAVFGMKCPIFGNISNFPVINAPFFKLVAAPLALIHLSDFHKFQ